MVRKAINILPPLRLWPSCGSRCTGFVLAGEATADLLLTPPTSLASQELLPELDESVPESVKRILTTKGVVLLVPERGSGR
jgi:hypothetical protein